MKKVKFLFFIFFCSLLFLSGCLQTNILEELGIATIYGFDKTEETGTLRSTIVLFQFNPDVSDASQVIHSEGTTFRELRNNANMKSGYKIVSGQLRTILFGPEIAKEGIFRYIDTLERDASISDMVYITISDQQAEQVLAASNYEQAPNVGTYIQQMIETAERDERLMNNSLHVFIRKFFSVGIDPLVPIIENKENKVQLTKVAVLQNDKYVGTISMEEVFYTRLLSDKFQQGQIEMSLPFDKFQNLLEEFEEKDKDEFYIVLDQLSSSSKIKVTNLESLKFKVDIEMQARIVELTERIDLQKREALDLIESEVNKEIKGKIIDLIKKSKELNSDFFGFGKTYSTTQAGKDLTKEQWRDMYPEIEVEINVNTEIRSYGIVE